MESKADRVPFELEDPSGENVLVQFQEVQGTFPENESFLFIDFRFPISDLFRFIHLPSLACLSTAFCLPWWHLYSFT